MPPQFQPLRLYVKQDKSVESSAYGVKPVIKRATGYFAIENILGDKIHASANIKKNTVRLTARTTTLIQQIEQAIPPPTKVGGILAQI
jgi:DNA-directed RNA polymerase subunit L